ncbi:ribosomal protein S18 acetylase RimI-like enzyme [Natronocella acetinitrilica]|uniref:Ribosomal protein S18 acetylase RimI-like enzyme n=1 Tax=Natronocella acetinitrilica TaxID=414046 RepID=A0AAE3KG04_9GAMM|nr:GNAT family N-acetyltransferase [Natronocella acetinitrilica]MCP1674662.1 ribosomal protein S18 acetylase RimI-like enzyme [Natronocella acetinitrilica]
MSRLRVEAAHLEDPANAAGVVSCLDAYAASDMGLGRPLTAAVKAELIPGLRRTPGAVVFLAWSGELAVGVAVCLMGYSTFNARPRLNVHDLAVIPARQGQGVGRGLLEAVIRHAEEQGCVAVTLEVRTDNDRAMGLYRSMGFGDGGEPMLFWKKEL